MSNLILVLAMTALGAPDASSATESTVRVPLAQSMARETEMLFERYGQEQVIVRERTNGEAATFSAEPALLERGSKLVVEVYTVAARGTVLRFRCVARDDVAECLGKPLRVAWLPDDDRAVLVARIEPDSLDFARGILAVR
jgi:hypothetical protein